MNKKELSERDICTKFITPAVKNAGWDLLSQVREELGFTKGRIIVRGKLVTRGKAKRADYALYYRPNLPIALIEQRARRRADYGEETLVHLSASLSAEFGRGFSRANLEYMRKFYLFWQDRPGLISQTASGKLPDVKKRAHSDFSFRQ